MDNAFYLFGYFYNSFLDHFVIADNVQFCIGGNKSYFGMQYCGPKDIFKESSKRKEVPPTVLEQAKEMSDTHEKENRDKDAAQKAMAEQPELANKIVAAILAKRAIPVPA